MVAFVQGITKMSNMDQSIMIDEVMTWAKKKN